MSFSELSHDAFLGGQLHLWQPKKGYRAGVDPVLLAASVPAERGQSILDVGCGAGAAILCLGRRVPGLFLSGLELQRDYAELAKRNADEAGLTVQIVEGDIVTPPSEIKQLSFDHVITNPPYFDRSAGTHADDPGKDRALGWQVSPGEWLQACVKRVKPKGWVHLIHRTEALEPLIKGVPDNLGNIEICPIFPRVGRKAELVLMRARKDGRRPLRLMAPITLHKGTHHSHDGDDYAEDISAVLRNGASLPFVGG